MAKPIKNKKVLAQRFQSKPASAKPTGGFKAFADKIEKRKLKKREKKQDAVTRVIKRSRTNKTTDSRMPSGKKIKFDLEDTGYQFTHKGKLIADMENFDDDLVSVSEDSQMDAEFVEKTHFSGFAQPEGEQGGRTHPKTKKQVYQEIIAKSRMYRYAKQKAAEQNFEKTHDLDENFEQVANELQFRTKQKKYADSLHRSNDFLILMNDLKDDVMVAPDLAPKTQESQARTENKRKMKKIAQLQQLEEEDEDVDVRDMRGGSDQEEEDEEEDDEDELDEVDLSGDEQEGEEGSEQEQLQVEESEEGDEEDEGSNNEQYSNKEQF